MNPEFRYKSTWVLCWWTWRNIVHCSALLWWTHLWYKRLQWFTHFHHIIHSTTHLLNIYLQLFYISQRAKHNFLHVNLALRTQTFSCIYHNCTSVNFLFMNLSRNWRQYICLVVFDLSANILSRRSFIRHSISHFR